MKNRTAQLIWQTFYCTLALVAIIGSVGFGLTFPKVLMITPSSSMR